MYICISNKAKTLKSNIMKITAKLAIETYATLTNQTVERITELASNKDEVVCSNIQMLMFSVAS